MKLTLFRHNCPKDVEFKNGNDTLKQHTMRIFSANIHMYFFHDLEFKFNHCFPHYGNKFKV